MSRIENLETSVEKTLALLHWPERSGEYKIVQVEIDDVSYLRIREEPYCYHSDILKNILVGLRVRDYPEMKSRNGKRVIPIDTDRNRYRVIGMGHVSVNNEENAADFYGKSVDYAISIDRENIEYLDTIVLDRKLTVRDSHF